MSAPSSAPVGLTREQVEELDALYAGATKGPWFAAHDGDGSDVISWVPWKDKTLRNVVAECVSDQTESDAALIVALVNAWPKLREMAGALERLTERVEMVNRGVAESVELIGLAQEARATLSGKEPGRG